MARSGDDPHSFGADPAYGLVTVDMPVKDCQRLADLVKNSRFGNSYGGSSESVPRALASSCTSKVYENFVRTAARHGPIHYFNYSRPFVGRRLANGTGCCTFTWAPIWTSRVRHEHAYFLLTPEPGRPQAISRSGPGTTGRQPIGPHSPTNSKQRARSI